MRNYIQEVIEEQRAYSDSKKAKWKSVFSGPTDLIKSAVRTGTGYLGPTGTLGAVAGLLITGGIIGATAGAVLARNWNHGLYDGAVRLTSASFGMGADAKNYEGLDPDAIYPAGRTPRGAGKFDYFDTTKNNLSKGKKVTQSVANGVLGVANVARYVTNEAINAGERFERTRANADKFGRLEEIAKRNGVSPKVAHKRQIAIEETETRKNNARKILATLTPEVINLRNQIRAIKATGVAPTNAKIKDYRDKVDQHNIALGDLGELNAYRYMDYRVI